MHKISLNQKDSNFFIIFGKVINVLICFNPKTNSIFVKPRDILLLFANKPSFRSLPNFMKDTP